MSSYADALLRFAHAASHRMRGPVTEVFTVGTRLTRVTREMAHRDAEVALRAIAAHRVGDRPDRVEPRVVKRRPKAYPRMHESRRSFKKRKRLVPAA